MLTRADDWPVHQTPEPIAFAGTDRNFYDRYFFNGMTPDGSLFFAVAFGVYPQLDIMDAALSVQFEGVQHNLHCSKHMGGDRLDLTVGPISIVIDVPLEQLTISIAGNDGPVTGAMTFTARHTPIEEPRFTRRIGTRGFMDYTRMTQNGAWSGHLSVNGTRLNLDPATVYGTRDRSWGIRPVGASDPQPPVGGGLSQFYWLWTPCNFDTYVAFCHTNDDEYGRPWNRRAVVQPIGGAAIEYEEAAPTITYTPGTRRIQEISFALSGHEGTATLSFVPERHFYMAGLGYTHPEWGHGTDHGPLAVHADSIALADIDDTNPLFLHIQALSKAVLEIDGTRHEGRGVVEQMFVGPHAPSAMTDLFDPAGEA